MRSISVKSWIAFCSASTREAARADSVVAISLFRCEESFYWMIEDWRRSEGL